MVFVFITFPFTMMWRDTCGRRAPMEPPDAPMHPLDQVGAIDPRLTSRNREKTTKSSRRAAGGVPLFVLKTTEGCPHRVTTVNENAPERSDRSGT
jgi:hypothetical protein